MSLKISKNIAFEIANVITSFINRAKIYFSDNTDYITDNVLLELIEDNANFAYIINIMFSVNLDSNKTITKIEYYQVTSSSDILILMKDEMNLELTTGINSISHQLSLSYQVE